VPCGRYPEDIYTCSLEDGTKAHGIRAPHPKLLDPRAGINGGDPSFNARPKPITILKPQRFLPGPPLRQTNGCAILSEIKMLLSRNYATRIVARPNLAAFQIKRAV